MNQNPHGIKINGAFFDNKKTNSRYIKGTNPYFSGDVSIKADDLKRIARALEGACDVRIRFAAWEKEGPRTEYTSVQITIEPDRQQRQAPPPPPQSSGSWNTDQQDQQDPQDVIPF